MNNFDTIVNQYKKSTKTIEIKTDIMPIIFRDDEFEKMKNLGIDTVEFNEFQYGMLGDKTVEKALEILEDYKLNVIFGLFKIYYEKYGIERALNYDFTKHPIIKKISIFDEPDIHQIDNCYEISMQMEKKCPNLPISTNIYPAYVDKGVLGCEYEEYVKQFFEKVVIKLHNTKIVSCDFYPFELIDGNNIMNDLWFYNHQLFAEYAKKCNAILEWCVQTCNYNLHRIVRTEDVIMQFYMCLAFGVTSISCFAYANPLLNPDFPEGSNAMIGHNYQPTSMYYDTKEAIKELRKIEKVSACFKYNSSSGFIGYNNKERKNISFEKAKFNTSVFKHIKRIDCAEDTVVTEMYDENHDNYGYYVINYNDPILKIKDKVMINLDNAEGAIVYLYGEPNRYDGKKIEFTLDIGAGALIIPYAN